MRTLLDRLAARWKQHGLTIRPGVTRNALDGFERTHGVRLDPAIREIYGGIDGMEVGEMDPANLIRFWPLSEMIPVEQEMPRAAPSYTGYVLFADHSMWAHGYGWRTSSSVPPAASVAIVGGKGPMEVAPTFARFIELYLSDDQGLFGSGTGR